MARPSIFYRTPSYPASPATGSFLPAPSRIPTVPQPSWGAPARAYRRVYWLYPNRFQVFPSSRERSISNLKASSSKSKKR